jgi:hypothetical protein
MHLESLLVYSYTGEAIPDLRAAVQRDLFLPDETSENPTAAARPFDR